MEGGKKKNKVELMKRCYMRFGVGIGGLEYFLLGSLEEEFGEYFIVFFRVI